MEDEEYIDPHDLVVFDETHDPDYEPNEDGIVYYNSRNTCLC